MEGFQQKDLLSSGFLNSSWKVCSWQPIRRCPSDVHTPSEDVRQWVGEVSGKPKLITLYYYHFITLGETEGQREQLLACSQKAAQWCQQSSQVHSSCQMVAEICQPQALSLSLPRRQFCWLKRRVVVLPLFNHCAGLLSRQISLRPKVVFFLT